MKTGQDKNGANEGSVKSIRKAVARVWSSTDLLRTTLDASMQVVSRNEGNSLINERYQAVKGVGTTALTLGLAFAAGGGFVGLSAMAGTAISYGRKIEQFNYERRWEMYGLTEKRARAGANFNRSRL
nr:MAG TPA: hypothetical protein [Caudoviricetes sp.]